MSLLEVKNLHVRVDNHEILKGIDLKVNAGEVHSIMGPNGSGKSTLAQVLARRETYNVTSGEVSYNGKDLLAMKPEEAACEGIFMAFQYPVEISGISNAYFLRSALDAIRNPERAIVVVTHYQRLLNYIVPDFVHVLVDGRIVRSGDPELALELEEKGYGGMEAEARHATPA